MPLLESPHSETLHKIWPFEMLGLGDFPKVFLLFQMWTFCTNRREKVSEPAFLFQLLKQVAIVQCLSSNAHRRTLFLSFRVCRIALFFWRRYLSCCEQGARIPTVPLVNVSVRPLDNVGGYHSWDLSLSVPFTANTSALALTRVFFIVGLSTSKLTGKTW